MKTKSLLMLLLAVVSFGFWSCSDDDNGGSAAVGITNVTITPNGSAKSYNCSIDQAMGLIENSSDSVDWDVTDIALTKTVVKVTATLNTAVYYNDQVVGADGVEVDATNPVTLTAKDNSGNTKVYTLKVVRATSASGESMLLKSSSFLGLPSNLLYYDMAYFKNKFYALAVSVTGDGENRIENYQLFSSENGLNWTEVNYQTDATGVVLPEGQDKYVIGGEGARLVVFNDRMYVLGGARTQGADVYGNAAEVSWGMASIANWRSFSTADGLTFKTDTVGASFVRADGTVTPYNTTLRSAYMNALVFNGKLYMKSGYNISFGMGQNAQLYACTSDGKAWTQISPVGAEGESVDVGRRLGDAFFSFKGKLWCVGGFVNFLSSSSNNTCGTVYSSEDGVTWKLESDTVSNVLKNLYGMKVVANDNVAYMFGGERLVDNGGTLTREVSSDIFRSTDGITWEKVSAPQSYTGRRSPSVLLEGNSAWIFGGIKSLSSDNYAFPSVNDELATDTWIKLMN